MLINQNHNNLDQIFDLINRKQYVFRSPATLQAIWIDFGWAEKDVLEALKNLDPSQCYKNEIHGLSRKRAEYRNVYYDYYRAKKLFRGEDVYTHFYVYKGELIINGLKPV